MTLDGGGVGVGVAPEVIDGGAPLAVPGSELPLMPSSCWPVDITCVPDWDDQVEDESEGADEGAMVDRYSFAAKEFAVALAGQTMRLLTAYRVGGCPVTVRPCRSACDTSTWRTYPVLGGPSSAPWFPVSLGGTWLNIGCGHDAGGCGCRGLSEVRLHGPASLVTEVKVGGITLDPTAYRLDRGGRLVRTDGDVWPLCQNLGAPDTELDTWSVTYLPGQPVDGLGARAAGVLAGEYVKACSGEDCALPENATTVARSGVTITLTPGVFPGGRTGIRTVDAYLERWNPNALKAPSMAWSPDIARNR